MVGKQADEKNCPLMFAVKGQSTGQNPAGQLYIQKNSLIIEFLGQPEPVKIHASDIKKRVQFFEESIELSHAQNPTKKIILLPYLDSQSRFNFYGIRNWVQESSNLQPFRNTQTPYRRFNDWFCRLLAFFQLLLPYLIYYALLAIGQATEHKNEMIESVFQQWEKLVFSPIVAVHYVLFAPFLFFVIFFSHHWSLFWLTVLSWLMVLGMVIFCIVDQGNYYRVMSPYIAFMSLLALYYMIAVNRFNTQFH